MTTTINIAKDFSRTPAGRFRTDGPYNGEKFRDDVLIPALRAAEKVVVDLDGGAGYGSSFLEEVFGGLVRVGNFSSQELRQRIDLQTKDPTLVTEVWEYIDRAQQKAH